MLQNIITQNVSQFWQYLDQSQSACIRVIHLLIASLIIVQIIDSNFMHVHYQMQASYNLGTLIHIICGCMIALLSVFLFSSKPLRGSFPF